MDAKGSNTAETIPVLLIIRRETLALNVWTVTVAVATALAATETEAGAKEHDPLRGTVAQFRATVPLNPLTGTILISNVAALPAATESAGVAEVRLKVGVPTVVLVEMAPSKPWT